MSLVLNHPGWVTFNEEKWNLKSERISIGEQIGSGMWAETVVYVNTSGKLKSPKRSPYHHIDFRSTSSSAPQRRESQWLTASQHIAQRMDSIGLTGAVALGPPVRDVRAWQWRGHRAEVRYTYVLNFPYDLATASNSVRKNIKKAQRGGYTCARENDFGAILSCLRASESRQKFSYGIDAQDLSRLSKLMSDENCRMYVCRDSHGRAVSSRVVLHRAQAEAIDWIAGTDGSHLNQGVTQLLIGYVLQDLAEAGAVAFDYGGANIESVARSKSEWGGGLTPFYVVQPRTIKLMALEAQRWLKSTSYRTRSR